MEHSDYERQLGARLAEVRAHVGLSLRGVEKKSEGAIKAARLLSYEHGHRSVSVAQLAELAEFYGVPVAELLPGGGGAPRGIDTPMRGLLRTLRDAATELLSEVEGPPVAAEVRPETRGELERFLAEVREVADLRELVRQIRTQSRSVEVYAPSGVS